MSSSSNMSMFIASLVVDWRAWLEKLDGNLEFAKARGVEGGADMKKWNQLDPPEGFDPMLYIKRGDFEYDSNNMDAGETHLRRMFKTK